jgi:hypothetical protein
MMTISSRGLIAGQIVLAGLLGTLFNTMPCSAQHAAANQTATADYRAKLAHYEQVHGAYMEHAAAYWQNVAEKRKLRNAKRSQHKPIDLDDYVLTQPPVYSGPPRPIDPQPTGQAANEQPPIPTVADFLKAAAEEFGFVPALPRDDSEFKLTYARAAAAAGLNKEQVVGVYAFETGGNGVYNTQAGVTPQRARAISPAVGYNQLLSTNTVSLLAENGNRYTAILRMKAVTLRGESRRVMERKIEAIGRMIAFCRSVPDRWSEHDRLAKTTRGGWGVHAAALDVDLGPLLQVQKLIDSVQFARSKGYTGSLSAPELELMNLTGDGNGIDMVMMPKALRERVPTANFFQQQGYERNPIARRTKVVATLMADIAAEMRRGLQAQGARELAKAF